MKRIRYLIILVIFQPVTILSFGQNNTPQPVNLDVFPPTPNAAALMRFTDVPVSLSTGIPGISVPIYSYKGNNGLKFDVSIDYHSGGIKVEEVASDVGIGWALDAGGQVARIVRGMPDDYSPGGYFSLGSLAPAAQIMDDYNTRSILTAQYMYQNQIDAQNDIFSYSIGGKSGKFVFGLDGSYVVIPQSKIQIQRILSGSQLTGFIITDIDGTQYDFMQPDDMGNSFILNGVGSTQYATTWNLTKVVAPYGTDNIVLTYEPYGLTYVEGHVQTQYVDALTYTTDFSRNVDQVNQFSGTANRIKTISFPDGTLINFSYEAYSRMDIEAAGALKQVLIANNGNSHGYNLWHSYGGGRSYTSPTTVSTALRLQLDSITEFTGSTSLPSYQFTYNGTLPDRMSTAQDTWGYYYGNVRQNPNTLIPVYYVGAQTVLPGADRTPDPIAAQTGVLTSIRWPTGGTTTYAYESNTAPSTQVSDGVPQTVNVANMLNLLTNGYQIFTVNRPLENNQPITFNFSLMSWCPGVDQNCFFTFSVTSTDNSVTYAAANFAFSDLGTTKSLTVIGFTNGDYKLSFTAGGAQNCTCSEFMNFTLNYNQLVPNSPGSDLVGGLRIKSVTQYDGINHLNDMIREFYYQNADGSTSGTVWLKPSFAYSYFETTGWDPNYCGYSAYTNYLVRSSAVNYPLTYTNGAPDIYGRVTVKDKIGSNYNGQTVSSFRDYYTISGPCTEGSGGNCFPYAQQVMLDFGVGFPTEEDIYDNNNTLLKKTIDTYNYVETENTADNFRSIKFGLLGQNLPSTYCIRSLTLGYREYYPVTGRIEKSAETITEYGLDGSSLVKETDYAFDPVYLNLKSQATTNSKGQRIETRYYYPYDYTAGNAILSMKNSGIIAPVVSIEQWLEDGANNYLINGSIVDYGTYGSNIIRPSKLYTMKSPAPVPQSIIGDFNPGVLNRNPQYFIPENSYDQYDNKGNILQYETRSTPESIIWDVNGQYPVAKVEGANIGSIAYCGFEADGTGNWIPGSSLRAAGGITGKQYYQLANGSISYNGSLQTGSSFTVSYWSSDGPQLVNSHAPDVTGMTVNGWTYYEHKITNTSGITLSTGSGSGAIDELRLYPKGALMTTYAYTPMIGVNSVCDPGSRITYYEYDGYGRLKLIRDQERNILKTFTYQYQEQQ
jgi:YD repeat-containing protein